MDRRIKKTETAILNATLALLEKTPITELSIKEICNYANVSRSTFYLHYLNPTDIIEQLFNNVCASLTKTLDNFDFSTVLTNPKAFLRDIMYTVDIYVEQLTQLLKTNYHSNFRRRLKKVLEDKILKDNAYRYVERDQFVYSVNFIMSGLVESMCDNLQDLQDEKKRVLFTDTLTKQIANGFKIN